MLNSASKTENNDYKLILKCSQCPKHRIKGYSYNQIIQLGNMSE